MDDNESELLPAKMLEPNDVEEVSTIVAPLEDTSQAPTLQEGDRITITLGNWRVAATTVLGVDGDEVYCSFPAIVSIKAKGHEWVLGWAGPQVDALRVAHALGRR